MNILKKTLACLLVISVFLPAHQALLTGEAEAAGRSPVRPLRGKHAIELSIGLLSEFRSETFASAGNRTTTSEASGFIGSIAYTYWLEEYAGFHITSGSIDVDVTTSTDGSRTFTEAWTVVPVLFGIKYQPFQRPIGEAMRPYISASAGPYIGFSSNARSGPGNSQESYSESVLGSRLGAGIDLSISRLFTIGVGAGYHFVEDFDRPIGAEKNYSGPDFALSFGVVFGRGR
jgi:hypothetical protein